MGYFSLNSTTGEISKAISLRNVKRYPTEVILTIRGADSAPIPRSTTCSVKIISADTLNIENSFQLKKLLIIFKKNLKKINFRYSFYINLYDNTEIGTKLAIISLNSSSIETETGLVTFSFKNPCDLLNLHFASGKISLARNLPIIDKKKDKHCTILAISSTLANETATVFIKVNIF